MTEEWREIPDFPGYEASSLGRFRSFQGRGTQSGALVTTPRILAQRPTTNGYLKLNLRQRGRRVTVLAHRLIAMAFVDGYRPGLLACHNDSVKTNNVPSNLRWDDAVGNAIDASKLGDIPRQVLDIERVREIRSLYETGEHTHRSLSQQFGVTHQAIRDLLIRKNYRWVA